MRYAIRPIRTLPQRAWQYWRNRALEISTVLFDRFIYRPKALAAIRDKTNSVAVNHRQIVFVADKPRGREAKLAGVLKSQGWEVILLYQVRPNFPLDDYFTKAIRYHQSWQALYLAAQLSPLAFHVFTLWDYSTADLFGWHKPGKVVIDINDTIKGTASEKYIASSSWIQKFVPMEKYLIENADGLCCRDFQVPNAARLGGYQRIKNSVFFPEYCWDEQVPETPKLSAENGELHIVLIGHFGLKSMGDEKEAGYWDIIKAFTAQGIHFHIYPHWFYKKVYFRNIYDTVFGDYYRLADENPYFHIHESVPMAVVAAEISRYDFGIHVMRAVLFEEQYERYTVEAMKVCTSARIADYIDAGLPIICTRGTYFYQYLKRFGIMVPMDKSDLESLPALLNAVDQRQAATGMTQARERLSLTHQANRLTVFYQQL
ncbi:MAG: hypothetical protein ABIA75_03695 [Candidatus Neomarinimicrobiota bacterium]